MLNANDVINRSEFMLNISPSDFGLEAEATGVKGLVQRIKEVAKRIFTVQHFTVIYTQTNDRRKARSAINEVVGWTPFKRIEYIHAQEIGHLEDGRLSNKRVLFVDNTCGMTSDSERFLPEAPANELRKKALEDRSINYCYYMASDSYADDDCYIERNWIEEGQFYCPKKCYTGFATQMRKQYADYFRLVGKKFLKLN